MQKGNIVDLKNKNAAEVPSKKTDSPISEELESAIQTLIYRLRELGPLSS